MKDLFFQFESGDNVNFLFAENEKIRVYAECDIPSGASADFGYLALKRAILEKLPDGFSASFWYDGQEHLLAADAKNGDPRVEIDF